MFPTVEFVSFVPKGPPNIMYTTYLMWTFFYSKEERVSHFDPKSKHHDFRGFYTLFWVGLSIMVITTGLRNCEILDTSIFSLAIAKV